MHLCRTARGTRDSSRAARGDRATMPLVAPEPASRFRMGSERLGDSPIASGCDSSVGVRPVCEIEPPTRPELRHVRHQIGVLAPVARSFLIPDNHVGRPTVSSIAVAHEVGAMGGASIACLNSRDRNLLGFRRDMLTAAAYGVGEFLFVHGDKPAVGGRTGELTVRAMIDEARQMTGAGVQSSAGVPRRGDRRRAAAAGLEAGRGLLLLSGQLLERRAAAVAGVDDVSVRSTPASWCWRARAWPGGWPRPSRTSIFRMR